MKKFYSHVIDPTVGGDQISLLEKTITIMDEVEDFLFDKKVLFKAANRFIGFTAMAWDQEDSLEYAYLTKQNVTVK